MANSLETLFISEETEKVADIEELQVIVPTLTNAFSKKGHSRSQVSGILMQLANDSFFPGILLICFLEGPQTRGGGTFYKKQYGLLKGD